MSEALQTLNDACEFIVDCLHTTAPPESEGYPLIRTPNVGRGRLVLDDVHRVSQETYELRTRRAVPEPGGLILAREAPAGNVAVVKTGEVVCLGQRTVHLRPDRSKVDPDFLCYFLLDAPQQSQLLAGETGATAGHVNLKDIRALPLHGLPILSVQGKAARILADYDDLIENNRRRMALLEDAARQLYREWFVRLRFPGYEHARILDGVPEGWELLKLRDVAAVNPSTIRNSFDGQIQYVDISAVTPGAINTVLNVEFRDAPSRARRLVKHGDIIWSCVRPNRRSHAIVWDPPSNLIVSTGFAVLTPSSVPTSYLYQVTTTDAFVGYLEQRARGAAYPAVLASDFEQAEILVPMTSLLQLYDADASRFVDLSANLKQQNENLRAARDLLLPRLMSGEIVV